MHESPMTEKLVLRWVEVIDERGHPRLEMRWSAPVPAVAAAPAAAAADLPAVTHAA